MGSLRQGGFTIAELAIVILILGIVSSIIANRFTGAGVSGARARAVQSMADSLADMTRVMANQAGTPSVFRGGPVFATASHTMLDVAAGGQVAVAPAHQASYRAAGLAILRSLVVTSQPTSSSPGSYMVQGYTVSVKNADGPAFDCSSIPSAAASGYGCVEFNNVPVQVLQSVLEDREGGLATVSPTGKTFGSVQHTPPVNGMVTMYLIKDLR